MAKLGQFHKKLGDSAHVLPDAVALEQRESARELYIHSQRGVALLVQWTCMMRFSEKANQSVYDVDPAQFKPAN